MKGFRLNKETLRSIQASTGMDAAVISHSDISDIEMNIENRIGSPLKPAVSVGGLSPRGSVYLMFNRLISSSQINKALRSIKP